MLGKIKSKLIESKEAWSREGRLLTGEDGRSDSRLPPGQRLVKQWPVLDLGVHPEVPQARWRLEVDGLVANPLVLDWQGLQQLPQSQQRCDIHCVTSWSMFDTDWRGVSARDLLAAVQPLPSARHVVLHAFDGYTTNVSLEVFSAPDAMIATHFGGEPLTKEHGGPVRMLVPQYYLWKSAKWLSRIEFVAEDRPGFWEVRGYHNEADPWLEQRYDWQ
ncbi:sulfite oxidase-like oxidoreductase [Radicibacter daui]|uniref:sulfite oxidase-like oxidoreductase n=1 Tax=Radicibacter daui TaxID=3064829 RepID=UPI004046F39D